MTRDGNNEELGGLEALARQLPREVLPPPDLWVAIAARLEPRDRLDHLTASLPTRVDPPGDLWPKIEARIAPARRKRLMLALAASVVVAVAVGIVLGERNGSGPDRGSGSFAADDTAGDGASAATDVDWVLGTAAVAGDVAADLTSELALVRGERLSIERAIAKEPGNVDLRELWAFTYETELELADAVSRTVMEYQRERG
ncbi:MAG TPA: hypothetical protein VMV37_06970 [Gammaproteobacteria bacterium]|nr:hypothetical protein [Gammaproteobacteria bacterium]